MEAAIEEIRARLIRIDEQLAGIVAAFPAGDMAGHARYHEMIIEEMAAKKQLRRAIFEQIIKGSVWAGLVAIATAGWAYIQDHIK